MLKSYLTVALRNLGRRPGFTLINVAGLTVGMAVCLLIGLFVRHELAADGFHEASDRIYRVYFTMRHDGQERNVRFSPAPLKAALETYGDVAAVARISSPGEQWLQTAAEAIRADVAMADPSLFDVFSFPLTHGDAATALDAPDAVVLSHDVAEKVFGADDPMGQTLEIVDRGTFTVTGVLAPVPTNASLRFGALVGIAHMQAAMERNGWHAFMLQTFVRMHAPHEVAALDADFAGLLARHAPEQIREDAVLHFQPLRDVYLNRAGVEGLAPQSDVRYAYILGGIALLIALIAAINFVNLSLALSTVREKEVGMRKTLGAFRGQLVRQFLGEATLLCGLALGLGVALAALMLPHFNALTARSLSLAPLMQPAAPLVLLGAALAFGLAAGWYPALYLSRFQPIQVLRSRFASGRRRVLLRRGFVAIQFVAAVALMAGTIVMQRQLEHLRTRHLGFAAEQLVSVPLPPDMVFDAYDRVTAFKAELLSHAAVRGVAATSQAPGTTRSWGLEVDLDDPGRAPIEAVVVGVDPDYLDVMGLSLRAGRGFSAAAGADASDAVLVNEAFVRQAGWTEAVGRKVETRLKPMPQAYVAGVVGDYHLEPLLYALRPVVLTTNRYFTPRYFLLRVDATGMQEALAVLQERWTAFAPDRPLAYQFVDEQYRQHYAFEQRWSRIVRYAALLAIFVACLGLFGIASLTMARRRKEIGVRRVLGASTPALLVLLAREFVVLVLLACIVAWPLAYVAAQRWLQDYPYRIPITGSVFLLTGAIALAVALAAVGYQAVKAARTNPAEALRYE